MFNSVINLKSNIFHITYTHLTRHFGFFTTPIFYVNAAPHIGHLYSAVLADAVHRFNKLLCDDKYIFSTGTDEHGTKIQNAAASSNMLPREYCDLLSKEYCSLFTKCDVSFSDFIRTTEERHIKAVHSFWNLLKDRGFIYSGKYSGWYCVPEESFLGEDQLVEKEYADGRKIKVSADSGHPVEWTVEENYMFRLSTFQDDLLYWLKNENVVKPKKFHQQLQYWIQDGYILKDLSVSRPKERVHWGIPVPGEPNHTVYVWLDALVNYLTVAGYPHPDFKKNWPPSVQVIGKDILKFHGIYWPAFLLAAGFEPPDTLFCHSHWTVEDEKMSKSKGNVVDPEIPIQLYSSSGLRYFLLREGVPHSDGNYSNQKLLRIVNSELADTLGNLLNRCCGSVVNPQQIFPALNVDMHRNFNSNRESADFLDSVSNLSEVVMQHFEDFNFYKGIDEIIATLHKANKFFEVNQPWNLVKQEDNKENVHTIIHIIMETLRVCGIMLQPIIPSLTDILLSKLMIPKTERMWKQAKPSWKTFPTTKDNIRLSQDNVVLYRRILAPKTKAVQ